MRTGLIVFGVIFIVVGLLLYFVPTQQVTADTSTTDGGAVYTQTSSAKLTVPVEWAYASGFIGFILLVLGMALPSSTTRKILKKDSYDRTVESKENIEVGDGNKRKIVRERTEIHRGRKNDD